MGIYNTLEKIRERKEEIKNKIGNASWLRGIGVGIKNGDYFIKINITEITPETRDILRNITCSYYCDVIVEEAGEIIPQ